MILCSSRNGMIFVFIGILIHVLCISVQDPITDKLINSDTFSFEIPVTTFKSDGGSIYMKILQKPNWMTSEFTAPKFVHNYDVDNTRSLVIRNWSGKDRLYSADGSSFKIIDINTNQILSSLSMNQLNEVVVHLNYAYLPDWYRGLKIVNIGDETNPAQVGYFHSNALRGISFFDDYCYLIDQYTGFIIVNCQYPHSPSQTSKISFQHGYRIQIDSNYAFVSAMDVDNSVRIIDISNKHSPRIISKVTGFSAYGLLYHNNTLFVSDPWQHKVYVIDVTDRHNPTVSCTKSAKDPYLFFVENKHLFVGNRLYGFKIYDISNLKDPKLVQNFARDPGDSDTYKVTMYRNRLYNSDGYVGINVYDFGSITIHGTIEDHKSYCGNDTIIVLGEDDQNQITTSFRLVYPHLCDPDNSWKCNQQTHKCECRKGYFGTKCEVFSCFGVLSNTTSEKYELCSGHGKCVSYNNCECDDEKTTNTGYSGDDCGIWSCFGIENIEEDLVCSGHGICVDIDECKCTSKLYTGKSCNYWSCFGTPAYLQTVCSTHGSCIDFNLCICSKGYFDSNCSDWFCGKFERTNSFDVCNGKGKCVSSDFCFCDQKSIVGKLCESFTCGSLDHESPLVCSGHGKCLKPDVCSCSNGYDGEFCDNSYLFNSVFYPILGVSVSVICIGFCFVIGLIIVFCCIISICGLGVFYLIIKNKEHRDGISKYRQLKHFDILMKEQEIDDSTTSFLSVINSKINENRSMFSIDMDAVQIVEFIGEGGSRSTVYLANWHEELVAFKLFKFRTICSSQKDFDEFCKELSIFSSMSHPSIVQFYGASLKLPRLGIVMEYCSNGEILDYIVKHKEEKSHLQNTNGIKKRMLGEIVSGMIYLHERNVIHRDLKAENVLVSKSETAKIMDFGLSRVFERTSQTKTKKIGTEFYIAPELINDDEKYDGKCDVFSFGILVFVIYSENSNPYGDNQMNVHFKVANDEKFRPDVNSLDEGIRETKSWIIEMIMKCWKHDQNERPSFKELQQEYF